MKRSLLFLVVFVLFAAGIYADDERISPFSLSAGFTFTNNPVIFGGHFDFGIDFFRNKIYLQNNILLRACRFDLDDMDNTALTLSEKLVFGFGRVFMMYVYIEGGAGFYSNEQNSFSSDTFIYTFGGGGGIEFGSKNFCCIYLEGGYIGQRLIDDSLLNGVAAQAGLRLYF
jgi:hypothetical protein